MIASLPGIAERVVLLPNTHSCHGFPVGTVAAFDLSNGVVSIGGVGHDINCGIRMITTNLIAQDIEKKVETLIKELYKYIPCGVHGFGKITLAKEELTGIMKQGARWVIENRGFGKIEELDFIEDGGYEPDALPECVSEEAFEKEKNHLGTLGTGGHYLELQVVEEVFDIEKEFELAPQKKIWVGIRK